MKTTYKYFMYFSSKFVKKLKGLNVCVYIYNREDLLGLKYETLVDININVSGWGEKLKNGIYFVVFLR